MKTFIIKKLFNQTIPLREATVDNAIQKGEGLRVALGNNSWILSADHLKHPLRHIVIKDKFSERDTKLFYFALPKDEPPQMKLL